MNTACKIKPSLVLCIFSPLLRLITHPENTRNNILTTHKLGQNYTHPEQYFVPVTVYLTDLLTDIETTEENIDGLNNAFRNVPYLSASRLSHITGSTLTTEGYHYHDHTDCPDIVNISLCKETLNYFYDNEDEDNRGTVFDNFYTEFLERISREYLCTIEELPKEHLGCFSTILNQDGLCKRGKRCRFDHSREALMEQWLTLYKELIGSPYNPSLRNPWTVAMPFALTLPR